MDREYMQEVINGMRKIVKPYLAKQLKKINFEGCGNTDKAEFETDFEIVLTLAEQALAIPSAEPKWIPVSERLPEEFESVLVCYKSQGGMAQAVSERFGTYTGYKWSALAGIEPIAWMPLPKPYKPHERSEE